MSTDLKTEIDLRGLNKFNAQLLGALIGTGQGGEGDAQRFIRAEAGQLAWEISRQLGPKSQDSAAKRLTWEMKRHLSVKPVTTNLDAEQQYSSTADFTWLYAGKNFVAGINDEDNQVRASADEAKEFLRVGQSSPDRGDAWQVLGHRGQSKATGGGGRISVLRLNRVRVSKSAFAAVKKQLSARIGVLRASFAYTAALFVPSKPIPQWIKKHFSTRANGRTILTAQLQGDRPTITFGSRSPGVVSNPYITDKIARAVEQRKHITAAKIKKIVKGYAYNWNTGQVFKPVVPKEGLE